MRGLLSSVTWAVAPLLIVTAMILAALTLAGKLCGAC